MVDICDSRGCQVGLVGGGGNPSPVFRKDVILLCLRVRVAYGCDCKGVVGGESVRRGPVVRGDSVVVVSRIGR